MEIRNNEYPDGICLYPSNKNVNLCSPCKTRTMTEDEKNKYGYPDLCKKIDIHNNDREVMENFAKKVKSSRKERGWTQKQLATKAELTQTAISQTEMCKKIQTITTVNKICNVFGWNIDNFIKKDIKKY